MKPSRVLGAVILLALLAGLLGYLSLLAPYAGFSGEALVDIPKGAGTRGIAALLSEAGVIRHSWQFLLARALRPSAKLQAGEYRFESPASVWAVFGRIERGDVFFHELVVPEGHNLFDIAASLEKLGGSSEEFLRAAGDAALIRDLAPEARTLEGYLFPDTYRISRHTTAEELCRLMTDRFRSAWTEIGASAPVHRTVTLASLIEKETGIAEERPLVASVYGNRLRIDMKLDCDPTAIYAALLEHRYRGTIYRSDLDSTHRYNTYQHGGLPPGPIANPGLGSLRAALEPARTDYLYFVAKPDGSGAHVFSKTIEEHNQAVRRYRRGNGTRKQANSAQRISGPRAAQPHHRGRMGGTRRPAGAGL